MVAPPVAVTVTVRVTGVKQNISVGVVPSVAGHRFVVSDDDETMIPAVDNVIYGCYRTLFWGLHAKLRC